MNLCELFLMDYLLQLTELIYRLLHGRTRPVPRTPDRTRDLVSVSFLLYNEQLLLKVDLAVSAEFLAFSVRQELIVALRDLELDLDFDDTNHGNPNQLSFLKNSVFSNWNDQK